MSASRKGRFSTCGWRTISVSWTGVPPPQAGGEPLWDLIEFIQFAGPAAALARVRCAIGRKHFTDLLTLVLVEGRWRIISKVFHYDIIGPAAG